jgi:hypothetical protein
MYILPLAVVNRSAAVKQVSALLERNGTHMISLEGGDPIQAANEFVETNGLALTAPPFRIDNIVYVPVDPRRTDFSAFYSWREVAPGTVPPKEVWRQFVWVADSLDVNTLLDQIVIGEPGLSVYRVLNAYLKANH